MVQLYTVPRDSPGAKPIKSTTGARLSAINRMQVYEAALSYNLVTLGNAEALETPGRAADYVRSAFDKDPTVEWLVAILLNRKNKPLARVVISQGTASSSLIHPREVFKPAIVASASAIILTHNHPSGDPSPSRADIQVTRQIREAAKIIGIDLLDHIIVGEKSEDPNGIGIYSFNDAGLI